MKTVAQLDDEIEEKLDALYRLPLTEFTAARNGFAKALGGPEGKRVRSLTKPALVPWTINQLYWTARPIHERLMKSGASLRVAQVATLEGRTANVRQAAEAHRAALTEAVQQGNEIAAGAGVRLAADALARMLEALSLSPRQPEHPGRLTDVVQPGAFEALVGVTPAASPRTLIFKRPRGDEIDRAETRRQERDRAREEAAQRRQAVAAAKAADQTLVRARAEEARALRAYERARVGVRAAEQALATARSRLSR